MQHTRREGTYHRLHQRCMNVVHHASRSGLQAVQGDEANVHILSSRHWPVLKQALACLLLIATLIALTPRAAQANTFTATITNKDNNFVACPGTNVCFGLLLGQTGCISQGPLNVTWYLGDPRYNSPVGYGLSFCYTFNNPGLYTVYVTVHNVYCGEDASAMVNFHCGDANISISPGGGCVYGAPRGTTGFVSNTHATCSNVPLQYSWNFGDGSTGSGSNPVHVYTASGNYLVNVSVTDGVLTTSVSFYQRVDVNSYCAHAAPQPAPDISSPSDQNN